MRVALITGSRADFNALYMVHKELCKYTKFQPVLIRADHWQLATPTDIAIICGDRYEMLEMAFKLNLNHIPIAHLAGGDLTEGSQDDCFRHAITKLSHIHFPTNHDAANRVLQMGEDPRHVHMVGSASLDLVLQTELLDRDATFAAVGLKTPQRALLVSFHPNTLGDTAQELRVLEAALRAWDGALVMVGPNRDQGWELIAASFGALSANPNVVYAHNFEPKVYHSLMYWCDAMVGNSSAGVYEAPSFGTPVVNIGDRQSGRIKANCVTDCGPERVDIIAAIAWAVAMKRFPPENPYGDGHASERIAKVLASIDEPRLLLHKMWYDLQKTGSRQPKVA